MEKHTSDSRSNGMRTFGEIDALRRQHGLTKRAVYVRAEVDGETWRRIERRMNEPNVATLRRLSQAVDVLIAEQGRAQG